MMPALFFATSSFEPPELVSTLPSRVLKVAVVVSTLNTRVSRRGERFSSLAVSLSIKASVGLGQYMALNEVRGCVLTNLGDDRVGACLQLVENRKDIRDILTLHNRTRRWGSRSRDGADGEEGKESTREEHVDRFNSLCKRERRVETRLWGAAAVSTSLNSVVFYTLDLLREFFDSEHIQG
jgi:hypothetical protein